MSNCDPQQSGPTHRRFCNKELRFTRDEMFEPEEHDIFTAMVQSFDDSNLRAVRCTCGSVKLFSPGKKGLIEFAPGKSGSDGYFDRKTTKRKWWQFWR